jgi:hypothetical protein
VSHSVVAKLSLAPNGIQFSDTVHMSIHVCQLTVNYALIDSDSQISCEHLFHHLVTVQYIIVQTKLHLLISSPLIKMASLG